MYLGSSTTSECELASLQIIPGVPIHHKQQLQENTALLHPTTQEIDQKACFHETNLKTIKNADAEGRPENL